MKKTLVVMVAWAMLGLTANAAMQALDFAVAVSGTATNSRAYTVRGTLEGVYVEVPAGAEATVTVATAEQTLFTKACTTSAFYPVEIPVYGTTGSALTFNTYGGTYATTTTTNEVVTWGGASNDVATTNTVITYKVLPTDSANAQAWYRKPVMAGLVTTTIVSTMRGTNWNVRLLYNP
jgi:hypothetical protein